MSRNAIWIMTLLIVTLFDTVVFAKQSRCQLSYFEKVPAQIEDPGQEIQNLFHQSATSLPKAIVRQGDKLFAGIRLSTLISDIEEVHLCVVVGKPLVGFGVRDNAVFLPKERVVLVNQERVQGLDGGRKQILFFHESLGALGYDDNNYQISSLFYIKASNPSLVVPEPVEESLQKNTAKKSVTENSEYQSSGGVTAVGGGGDGFTAEIKTALMTLLVNTLQDKSTPASYRTAKYINDVMNLSIEPNTYISEYNRVKTWPHFLSGVNRHTKKTALLIDQNRWVSLLGNRGNIEGENLKLLYSILAMVHSLPEELGI